MSLYNKNLSTLDTYFDSFREYRLLDRQEEKALSDKYQESMDLRETLQGGAVLSLPEALCIATRIADGLQAKQALIYHNLRLVVHIAVEYLRSDYHIDDLVQEGNLGLIRAIELYDPDNEAGARLSTYAIWWIRQFIKRYIITNRTTGKIPVYIGELMYKFHKLQQKHIELHNTSITTSDIMIGLDVTEETAMALQRLAAAPKSLDEMSMSQQEDDEEGEAHVQKYLVSSDDVQREVEDRETADLVAQFLLLIPKDRDRQVMIKRYGLKDGVYRTLEEVGQQHGLTRERVRQIERDCLRFLKDIVTDVMDKEDLE